MPPKRNLIFLFCLGLLILWPHHNYQEALAQGDHGRDLYAFQAVYEGQLPYKDFWWVYGPIAPYYYGIFYKILGVSIHSILIGQMILQLLTGFVVYLIARMMISPLAALLCACWSLAFWQDFIFTYNHTLGILFIALMLFFLCRFLNQVKKSDITWIFICIFIIGLVKINFGIVNLILCSLVLFRKKSLSWIPVIATFLGWIFAYWFFLRGLSISEIRECMPYWGDYQPHNISLIEAVRLFIENTYTDLLKTPTAMVLGILTIIAMARLIITQNILEKQFLTTLVLLAAFYILNLHEFIKSGVWYRIAWGQAISFLLLFFIIDYAFKMRRNIFYWIIWGIVAITLCIHVYDQHKKINAYKTPSHFISLPRGQVYTTQMTSHWIGSIEQATNFLTKTLKPSDMFFALPYDPLYYYLTNQNSPTRQLIFFEHTYIPQAQEIKIIQELESHPITHIVLSNFFKTDDHYRGTLGATYCPLIASYIFQNFTPVAQLGEWNDAPGWADHHGVTVLQRK